MTNLFDESGCPTEQKLQNFTKYVNRKSIARFLVQYELFKKQLHVKGSIVEAGVHHGGGLMAWAKLSTTLEPYNYHRQIFGFDTFEGFPDVDPKDIKGGEIPKEGYGSRVVEAGAFKENYDIFAELTGVIADYDQNRFINQIPKVEIIKGDANVTIPQFVKDRPSTLVSLLYLDFDIYSPTVTAIKSFLSRMPKGAILAFDELNDEYWPGETHALLEQLDLNKYGLKCFEFEPNISYIQL